QGRDLARDGLAIALHEGVVGAAIVEARHVTARERGDHQIALHHLHVQCGTLRRLQAARLGESGNGWNGKWGDKRDRASEATPFHRHIRIWQPHFPYTRVAPAPKHRTARRGVAALKLCGRRIPPSPTLVGSRARGPHHATSLANTALTGVSTR